MACGWWRDCGPESTRGTKRGEVTEGFDRKPEGKNGLREICRQCHKEIRRAYITAKMEDPEERAKETLRQRAKRGRISWVLWRELREQKRCAEWLREHPFETPRGQYGYVYVLMTFAGEVLYVGQTKNTVEHRVFIQGTAHKYDKDWFNEVALIDVYTYQTKDYDEGERWLIKQLNPVYNKVRPKPRRDIAPEPLSVVRGAV